MAYNKKSINLSERKGKPIKDLRGKTLGDLTVLNRAPNHRKPDGTAIKATYYRCQCSCGNMVQVSRAELTSKRYPKRSCGGSLGNHEPKNKSTS